MRSVGVWMADGDDSAGRKRTRRTGASQGDLVRRVMSEFRDGEWERRAGDPSELGKSALKTQWRNHLLERLERGDSLGQIDRDLRRIGGLSEEERAALWLLAWGEQQRRVSAAQVPGAGWNLVAGPGAAGDSGLRSTQSREVVVSALELARTETSMDVAVLGEIADGHEVVRVLAGEAESFGLAVGSSLPVEQTFCQRLLEGRLGNVVRDAIGDERVRDLEVTSAAGIGAYLGVPLTTVDARLFILCCLAHEQRPALCERDVLFLRGLGETIIREADTAPLG
jgi:GAF domain-containing protein